MPEQYNDYMAVHKSMLFTVLQEYNLGDSWRSLKASEIRFFYRPLIPSLEKLTAPKK